MTPTPALLAGIKIVDLTTMIAGPTFGRLFAELGADVIHIESPLGDDGRNSTTPYMGHEGVIYQLANRGKRDIVIDAKQPRGRDLIHTLVRDADIFIENMQPGVAERMGLSYDELRARNSRLVYVSISGWGREGPLADTPGYDVVLQGFAAAMRQPSPELPPVFSGAMVGDPAAPLLAAFAAMVALRDRERTGVGSYVTTSLVQAGLHVQQTRWLVAEDDPDPEYVRAQPGGLLAAGGKDGLYNVICAWTDAQFQRLCRIAGLDHLADDPAYATRLQRQDHATALNEVFTAWAAGYTRSDLLALLREHEIPCAPVYNGVRDLMQDPQVQANEFVVPIEHPTKGTLWEIGAAYEINGQRGQLRRSPMFGEHTDAILREHGLADEHIASLRADGVVQ